MDRNKMSNLYRVRIMVFNAIFNNICNLYKGPSIDTSYQVSVHLAEGFQRRRLKCEKLTDDRRRTTDDGRRTTDDGRQVMAKAHLSFGKVS